MHLVENISIPHTQARSMNYDQERSEMALPRINMVLIVPPVQPPDWNPPETDSDGPSKETSYPPYPRVFKVFAGRSMKHTPKLKLEEDPIKLTKIDTCHVEFPYSLVGNYSMKRRDQRKGHGLCLVINNEKFVSPRHKQRKGTHRDEYNLVETFRFLGYRVEIQRDCKSQDIIHLFDRISFLIEPEDDSFVCCILSHGSNNIVYGSDSEGVTLRTGEDSLEVKLTKCKKLENKPKLFFVSTCRQPKREPKPDSEGHKPEPDSEGQEPEPDSDQNPRADFAFNYATLPGEASWRFTDTGTFYINHLCQVLCKYATQETLSNIQKKVAQEVSKMEKHQMPTLEEQVTKNVYFFDDFFEEASNTTS